MINNVSLIAANELRRLFKLPLDMNNNSCRSTVSHDK